MLQLENIKKSYKTGDFIQHALKGVSLKFRENEFVAILGTSGSGKTTLLNIIGGLDRYDSGDLIISGKSTNDFKDKDWDAYRNNSVGFIFQNYNLINHISVLDNVEMSMTLSGVAPKEKKKRAIEVLEKVGLNEHMHKKPNQLSGGQMQRVAIARALVNNPEIILADEPTGALDSTTSIQIMELIKEIAKDKLVIMVTHNADLAKEYSNRVVELKDGTVISDSNPVEQNEKNKTEYKLKKTSMGFFTAMKLSFNNIRTKKGRTILTAFASSIGIIGISLILSLSNGFDKQINNFEESTLSGFPIMIQETTANITMEDMQSQRNNMLGIGSDEGKYPTNKEIYPHDPSKNSIMHSNIFTNEYVDYVEKIDKSIIKGISYTRLVNMNILKKDKEEKTSVLNTSAVNFTTYPNKLENSDKGYLESNYDLLEGKYPTEKTDLVMVVDSKNRLDTTILQALGLDYEADKISFDDIIGKEFKVILNNDYYKKSGSRYTINSDTNNLNNMYNSENAITLKITGIIRASADTKIAVLSSGISYSDELAKEYIKNSKESDIVKAQQESQLNILTGMPFIEDTSKVGQNNSMGAMMGQQSSNTSVTKDSILTMLGANDTPNMITIYPNDFNAKDKVTEYLNKWNEGKNDEDTIIYTDLAEKMTDLSGSIMSAITIVLVAFSAISLVVSTIMIAIITYISVLERTKEIGILRALGARKKDVTRVFNAETFIIGLCSGLLGITVTVLLTFPVNILLEELTELPNVAQLNPLHALMLVVISVILTLLGGWIPAKMASKKDPVDALRTE